MRRNHTGLCPLAEKAGYYEEKAGLLEEELYNALHMLCSLICLHREESGLKRRHQAYLHVRDEMDRMCAMDLEEIDRILDAVASFGIPEPETPAPQEM